MPLGISCHEWRINTKKVFSETHHSSHCSITSCQSDCCSVMSCRPHSSRRQRKALDVMSRQIRTSHLKTLNIRALQTDVTSDEFLRKTFLFNKHRPFAAQKLSFHAAKGRVLWCKSIPITMPLGVFCNTETLLLRDVYGHSALRICSNGVAVKCHSA